MKNLFSCTFLFAKGYINDGIGVARGTAFQEIRPPGAGFNTPATSDSLKKSWRGYRTTT